MRGRARQLFVALLASAVVFGFSGCGPSADSPYVEATRDSSLALEPGADYVVSVNDSNTGAIVKDGKPPWGRQPGTRGQRAEAVRDE